MLIEHLPQLFCIRLRDRPSGSWIEQSVGFVLNAGAERTPGSESVASKIAEALFTEAVRGYIESMSDGDVGWLAGLRDVHAGRCLALMHAQPGCDWTIDSLAQEIHTSRSVLAERFTTAVGVAPMQYLARWRMASAASRLRTQQGTLARIAEEVSYGSEAAFICAFKREYGVSPGAWRKRGAPAGSD